MAQKRGNMRSVEEVFQDRTIYKFKDKKFDKKLLQQAYNIMKLGPTSGNSCPLRIIFVETKTEKEKLLKCLDEGNVPKVKSAPVTALFAYDTKFFEKMDKTNPASPALQEFFASSKDVALDTAYRNSSLQAAYFMIAARSLGLDCGPMSGFNKDALEKDFLAGTDYKINFICNLGYRDGENPYDRQPRLDFDEACKVV